VPVVSILGELMMAPMKMISKLPDPKNQGQNKSSFGTDIILYDENARPGPALELEMPGRVEHPWYRYLASPRNGTGKQNYFCKIYLNIVRLGTNCTTGLIVR
jgi:hypothetical protein